MRRRETIRMMVSSTTAAGNLRANRTALGLSQSRLARLSGVSRFKICTHELGDATLTGEEQCQIRKALQVEIARLREIAREIEFDESSGGTLEDAG
jgi:predicted transcriptional regulator